MKYFIIICCSILSITSINAQKPNNNSKYELYATISNGKQNVKSKNNSYFMVFPHLKDRFDTKRAYIMTDEGQKLKMDDKTTTQWSWGMSQSGTTGQPMAYDGPSVSTSVEFSNGGRDVTITTTITTTAPDGSSKSETKTTTMRADGTGETKTKTTNTQETPDANPDVVIVVVD